MPTVKTPLGLNKTQRSKRNLYGTTPTGLESGLLLVYLFFKTSINEIFIFIHFAASCELPPGAKD